MSTPPGALQPHLIKQLRESFKMGDWVTDAACNPDTAHKFFPGVGQHSDSATAICADCPVIEKCRTYAVNSPDMVHGVWGGMSEEQLKEARRRAGTKVVVVADCGTAAAYARHIRSGEVPCAACRRAKAADRAKYRRAKKDAV